MRGHTGIFYITALPAMLLLANSSHDFPFAPYSKLVIYPLGRSTREPTSGGRSETDKVSHRQALDHRGAWDSPMVIATCRLIHWKAMWWQSSNSAYNDLAASLGSFFFFGWSEQGCCILFSQLCLWLFWKAGALSGNLRGIGYGEAWRPVPSHSRLGDLYLYY